MAHTTEGAAAAPGRALATTRMRIAVGDVDGGRLIYYAAPFGWCERLLSDWLAQAGHSFTTLFEADSALPVVSTTAAYHAALRQDELVDLELHVAREGNTSLTLRTDVRRVDDGVLAVQVTTVHVHVTGLSSELRPTPLPDWLRALLSG